MKSKCDDQQVTSALIILRNRENNGAGVGVTKPIFSVPLFSTFPLLSKQTVAIEYHVYIWQVSPQLSCGDTCQIWMWFRESNMCFCKIENFAYGEISERSFSNPHPWCLSDPNSVPIHPSCQSIAYMYVNTSQIPDNSTVFSKGYSTQLKKHWRSALLHGSLAVPLEKCH